MNAQKIKVSELKRNPDNPRIVNDLKYKKLLKSIQEFPQMLDLRPIVVDDDMIVLGGNMRLKACKELGIKEVPVIKASSLTKEQAREFIIKDNLSFGDWDIEALQVDWDVDLLEDWGLDIDFDAVKPDKVGLVDEDDTPSVPTIPKCEVGDVWILGKHRLMCGDSTLPSNQETLLDGAAIDMVFTDPPYGMSYGGGRQDTKNKFQMIMGDDEDPTLFYHVVPEARNVYIWGRVENYVHLKSKPKHVIVWKKNNFGLGKGYRSQYEVCFYWGDYAESDTNVWEVSKDSTSSYVHPTQKPVDLCIRAIENNKPENVLDLYGGSGSTMIACEMKHIPCFTMEYDPKYADVIIERWQNFTGEDAILEQTGEKFNSLGVKDEAVEM